jgi:hypothetical protein
LSRPIYASNQNNGLTVFKSAIHVEILETYTESLSALMRRLFESPLFSPLIAALVGGLLTLLATWWTLSTGFKNQRKILEDQQRERQRGAGWALISEMSDNLARLKMLSQLAHSEAPVAHMLRDLNLHRHTFDVQLPLLALRLSMDELHAVTAAYSGAGILFATLEGKWGHIPYADSCTKQDVEALDFTATEFEKTLRTVARTLLTDDERKAADLDEK